MVEFVYTSIPFLSNNFYNKNIHAIYHKLLAFHFLSQMKTWEKHTTCYSRRTIATAEALQKADIHMLESSQTYVKCI